MPVISDDFITDLKVILDKHSLSLSGEFSIFDKDSTIIQTITPIMTNDMIKLDILISAALKVRPDIERISRSEAADTRKD
jgi:hypothetical protein